MDTPPKMEARATAIAVPRGGRSAPPDPRVGSLRPRPASSVARDPFRLGFRERAVTTPDGRKVLEQIPLTPRDLVYPQEGDVVSDGFPHNWFLVPLYDAMRRHLGKLPATLVTFSTVLVLGDGKNCSPDVAVIKGDVDRSVIPRAVKLRAVGGRLVFALEAVSTSDKEIKDKDLETNVERYAEEGVAEYLTVFPVLERRVKDLVGRRLSDQGEYDEIPPDAHGRVYSEQLGLYFYIDESEELVAVDAETGQQLRLSDEEEERADRAEERADRAEERVEQEAEARQKAEAEKQEAEAEKQEAEAEKQKETAARQKAEAEKQKVEAEKQKETAARQKAEAEKQKVEAEKQKETAARQKAEAEKQKVEAEKQKVEAEKQTETAARQKAEADLEQESQARLQTLAEVERLKAQLRQIQEGGAG